MSLFNFNLLFVVPWDCGFDGRRSDRTGRSVIGDMVGTGIASVGAGVVSVGAGVVSSLGAGVVPDGAGVVLVVVSDGAGVVSVVVSDGAGVVSVVGAIVSVVG